jgi:hypothetical protein
MQASAGAAQAAGLDRHHERAKGAQVQFIDPVSATILCLLMH